MKRTLSLILTLCLCFGLVACEDNTNDSQHSSQEYTSETSNNYLRNDNFTDNDSPEHNDSPADNDENEATEPRHNLNIIAGKNFSDGVAFICYKDELGNYKKAAIDLTGKVLFEISDDVFNSGTYYKNGIMVIDNLVYDKNGEIIASPEISGYDELISSNCNGFVLAMKTEESFDGDKHLIGVLNNKGAWEYPLSSENPIARVYDEQIAEYGTEFSYIYVGEYIGDTILEISFGVIGTDEQYFNIVTNELTKGYNHYESRFYQGEPTGIYVYDLFGNRTLVLKDIIGEKFFDNAFIGAAMTGSENGYIEGGYKIYDYNGNAITDLSNYKFASHWSKYGPGVYYVNEHLLIPMDNGNGSKYLCLITKDGNTAFEPIKMGSEDDFYALDEKGFVYVARDEDNYNNTSYKLYDYSGNVTEYSDLTDFYGFSEGLALVRNVDGQYYYMNMKGEKVIY